MTRFDAHVLTGIAVVLVIWVGGMLVQAVGSILTAL